MFLSNALKLELLSCNIFAYCGNNPVNLTDSDGRWGFPATLNNFTEALIGTVEALIGFGSMVLERTPVGLAVLAFIGVFEYNSPKLANNDVIDEQSPSNDVNPKPYSHLKNPKSVAPGKKFTPNQKKKIIEENKIRNRGEVKSDDPTDIHPNLVKPEKSIKGIRPPANEWQIDHIIPKSKGGTNGYDNARVISRELNRLKWDK